MSSGTPEGGWQVGAIALPPIIGRLVNPIPIRGTDYVKGIASSKNLEGGGHNLPPDWKKVF
jgi:hypothetical protein